MKRIAVFIIGMAIVANATPLFAGEKSLFQTMYDTMNKKCQVREKNKMIPVKEVTIFQNMSKGIKEGSAKAKNTTLRVQK